MERARPPIRLGLLRDAEKQLLSALRHHQAVDIHLYLAKVYIRMDQPLTAMEVYNSALEKFPGETTLLIGIARLHEVRNSSSECLNGSSYSDLPNLVIRGPW